MGVYLLGFDLEPEVEAATLKFYLCLREGYRGFILGLLTGFPGLQPGWGDAQGWAGRAVTLPEGWTAIEIERIWIGGRPYKLVARQGAERAQMTPLCQDNRANDKRS